MKPIRERICSAAREIFLREGPQGLSMRRIAEKVGVTPPAIYRHFRDKDELLDEVVGSGLGILEAYLRPALDNGDPYRSLKGMIDAYLDFALEQPKFFDLAFLVPSPGGRLSEEIKRHNRTTFRFAVEQVARCMEAGIFSKADPLETSVMLWATAHGLVTFHRMQRLGLDGRQFRGLFRRTIDRVLDGLKPAGELRGGGRAARRVSRSLPSARGAGPRPPIRHAPPRAPSGRAARGDPRGRG